jgi:hypothetical protein
LITQLSRKRSLITIEFAPTRTGATLAWLLQRIVDLYWHASFCPQVIMMDIVFEKVKDLLPTVIINATAA